MNRIYLYGLADATDQYRVVRYSFIETENLSIEEIVKHASWLKIKNSGIEHVYAIDNRKGLAYECKRAMTRNSIEHNIVFKDLLETHGLMVI